MTDGRLSFPRSGECECDWGSKADWGEHQSCRLRKSRGWEKTYGHTEIYQLPLLQWGKSGLLKSRALFKWCVTTTVWYFMTPLPSLHLQNFMFEFQETQAVLFDKVIEISVSRRVWKHGCKTRHTVCRYNFKNVTWGRLNMSLYASQNITAITVFAYSDSVGFFSYEPLGCPQKDIGFSDEPYWFLQDWHQYSPQSTRWRCVCCVLCIHCVYSIWQLDAVYFCEQHMYTLTYIIFYIC